MRNFVNLKQAVRSMETDPSTAKQPIKRMFVADGDFMSANLSVLEETGGALHTQASHDEIVVVLEGDVDFRVGEESRRVGPGDFIFIPRNTIHGPIICEGQRFAALSVFAPFFDRGKQNITWERDKATSKEERMSFEASKHVFGPGQGGVLRQPAPAAGQVTILVEPGVTGETGFCTLIQTLDAGALVPVHHHEKAEQVLFFISGNGKAVVGGREVQACPGTTVHVPKGIKHGITNTSAEPLSFLETTSPSGFQELFRKLNQLSSPSAEEVVRIASEYDVLIDAGD